MKEVNELFQVEYNNIYQKFYQIKIEKQKEKVYNRKKYKFERN